MLFNFLYFLLLLASCRRKNILGVPFSIHFLKLCEVFRCRNHFWCCFVIDGVSVTFRVGLLVPFLTKVFQRSSMLYGFVLAQSSFLWPNEVLLFGLLWLWFSVFVCWLMTLCLYHLCLSLWVKQKLLCCFIFTICIPVSTVEFLFWRRGVPSTQSQCCPSFFAFSEMNYYIALYWYKCENLTHTWGRSQWRF